jgi:hypothetical protein
MFNIILHFFQHYIFPLFYLYLWVVSVYVWVYVWTLVLISKFWYFPSRSIWTSYCRRAPNKRPLKFSTIVISVIVAAATTIILFSIIRVLVLELFFLIIMLALLILFLRGLKKIMSRAFKSQDQGIK